MQSPRLLPVSPIPCVVSNGAPLFHLVSKAPQRQPTRTSPPSTKVLPLQPHPDSQGRSPRSMSFWCLGFPPTAAWTPHWPRSLMPLCIGRCGPMEILAQIWQIWLHAGDMETQGVDRWCCEVFVIPSCQKPWTRCCPCHSQPRASPHPCSRPTLPDSVRKKHWRFSCHSTISLPALPHPR